MIAVCGACSGFGLLVIERLLQHVPASDIVAVVRQAHLGAALAARGLRVRTADFGRAASLAHAFAGAEKLLLVASGGAQRLREHEEAISAARAVGVHLIAYTSVLHADTSSLPIAAEHRASEAALRSSGVPHVLLRKGCCVDTYVAAVPAALEYHAVLGCAGGACISSASRADYADAAAAVLLSQEPQDGQVHELCGGTSFTLPELAAEIGRQSGASVKYVDLPAAHYRTALVGAGVPAMQALQLVDADLAAGRGAFLGFEPDLERWTGRPATTIAQAVAHALAMRGTARRIEGGQGHARPSVAQRLWASVAVRIVAPAR